jgi:DNA polymerase elongation subunit (family B)
MLWNLFLGKKNVSSYQNSRFYENVPVLDFNALYPNIMMSYCLDPSLLVLDKRFANCPGVTYLRIRFSKTKEFLFAQGLLKDAFEQQGFPGVMIKHTRNLVNSRKIAQGIMETHKNRVEYTRKKLVQILGLAHDSKFT